jgi:uncharacterized membrane protein YsdA (DUF1294 family)
MREIALLYLAVINVLTFAAFAVDKRRAEQGSPRIPERVLLGLAVIGGTIGAIVAQMVLRHKTQKQPFASRLRMIVLAHGLLLSWILIRYGMR